MIKVDVQRKPGKSAVQAYRARAVRLQPAALPRRGERALPACSFSSHIVSARRRAGLSVHRLGIPLLYLNAADERFRSSPKVRV